MNKKNYTRLFIVFCTGLMTIFSTYYCIVPTSVQKDKSIAAVTPAWAVKKELPNEYEFFKRTFPNKKFDHRAYTKAIKAAHHKAQSLQKGVRKEGWNRPWTLEGPANIGGRINVVVANPSNEAIIYAGASQGGVFKTTDGGENWVSIFDDQPFLAIGSIALDPSDSETVYVGVGDLNISQSVATGDGVYRSRDGGSTWEHLGLDELGIISSIIVHPNNSDMIWVGSMGIPFERSEDRGLYRSLDGGQTWEQVLFVAEDAGIIDIVIDPFNPDHLYAASWNRIRNLQESIVSGDDAKIWKSTDGGENWQALSNGLPNINMGRIGLAISESTPNKVFAVYADTLNNLDNVYHTIDGGDSWMAISEYESIPSGLRNGFQWYFGKVEVNPKNDEELYLLGVELFKTTNGGESWELTVPDWWTYEVHADKHDLHFTPSGTLLLGTDGGIYKNEQNGNLDSWVDIENIPNTQFYRVAVNPHETGRYFGGAQDNGTTAGNRQNSTNWERVYGGDGFQTVFHPTNPDIFWVETQRGRIYVTFDGGDNFEGADVGIDGADRRNWDMPYSMSAHDSEVLYTGTYRIYRNHTATATVEYDGFVYSTAIWEPISPDLTDGVIFGNNFHNITAVAESPLNKDDLYAGTSDGNVWRSLDFGATWENITEGLPETYVTSIHASPHHPNTVYVTHSGYKGNADLPHIHRSDDNGTIWQDISQNLPPFAVNDLVIHPDDEEVLFAATDGGVYGSINGGNDWRVLGRGLPTISVYDIAYDPATERLIAGTFARSLYSFYVPAIFEQDVVLVDTLITTPYSPNITLEPVTIDTIAMFSKTTVNRTNLQLKVFPNPVVNQLYLSWQPTVNSAESWTIQMFNATGQLVQTRRVAANLGKLSLDVQELNTGVYIIRMTNGKEQWGQRIVKQ